MTRVAGESVEDLGNAATLLPAPGRLQQAVTQIAVDTDPHAAALVGAGTVSVLVLPQTALALAPYCRREPGGRGRHAPEST
jgi:hypothetical protein